ncbi:hypothetical protein [Crocosphaera sp. XPORK-15E]|uniref:hypothetical protein n=1 Tax=Crocosphaera sp. XPORK-15E TaxID=3110247 RepID=UPI002B21F6D8|nr:hypothetical protein [Crocosphaera sp. XPORK-15E]MEA5533357.1 hypothetical protein [Crocosphaera sp. XPORK-15E]
MHNLDSSNKADNILMTKGYIEQILNQLILDYQHTHEERAKITLWEENQEFSILGIIEMLTDTIRGYAFQIINNNSLENHKAIINELEKCKIFEIPEFTQWYFSSEFNYPQSKKYVEKLNYLRLLIIEYIRDIKAVSNCLLS